MIDYIKNIIGILPENTDFDLYLVIICAISLIWIAKSVITGLYQAVLHIFR